MTGTTSALPEWLSCLPEKLEAFEQDQAFLAGWATIVELDTRGDFDLNDLWGLGSVLFKSDSVLRGNVALGVDLLSAAGFVARDARVLSFDAARVRELWRYALGRLTEQRIALLARIMSYAPSLYVLLTACEASDAVPTTIRLTTFKGEAIPELRQSDQLRAAMGAPQSAMLNFVHTADEPADLVRELGLFFAEDERRALLRGVTGRAKPSRHALVERLGRFGGETLDFFAAKHNMIRAITDANSLHEGKRQSLIARAAALSPGQGREESWLAIRNELGKAGIAVDRLDEIVIGAALVPLKRPAPSQPFPSCELRHWQAAGIRAPA